jgi:hypothetical protein
MATRREPREKKEKRKEKGRRSRRRTSLDNGELKLPQLSKKASAMKKAMIEFPKTELEKAFEAIQTAIQRMYMGRGSSQASTQQLLVPGSMPLDNRGNSRAFGVKLVRSSSMKTYMGIFDGIAIGEDGTVQYEDFMRHLRDRAPNLAEHAGSMFDVLKRENKKKAAAMAGAVMAAAAANGRGGGSGDAPATEPTGVAFTSLVGVLFPGASPHEIQALLAMCKKRDDGEETLGSMLGKLDEARDVFEVLNKTGSGFLTRAEMKSAIRNGLTDLTDKDVLDLFGKIGTCFERGVAPFGVFFEWYSGVRVPVIIEDDNN